MKQHSIFCLRNKNGSIFNIHDETVTLRQKLFLRFYGQRGWCFTTNLWCLRLNRWLPRNLYSLLSLDYSRMKTNTFGSTIEAIFIVMTPFYISFHKNMFSKYKKSIYFSMRINKEQAYFLTINSMWNCGMCLSCCRGWVFDINVNQWTSIYILVYRMLLLWLFFTIFLTCCCLRRAHVEGEVGRVWQAGGSINIFIRIKTVV